MKQLFVALNVLFAAVCVAAADFVWGSPVRVDYVVQISIDGLRGDLLRVLLDTAPASYPSFQRLRTEGASTFNARCDYTISVTTPNHVCMVTGRPVHQPAGQPNTIHHGYTNNSPPVTDIIHGFNPNVPYVASVFDVIHDRGFSTVFLASKAKLGLIDRSYNATNGAADLFPPDDGNDKIDLAQAANGNTSGLLDTLVARLGSTPDAYTFLHLYQPDDAGHTYGWGTSQWNSAVATVDALLARLFAVIDANPSLAGRIAIVLTADHGGGGGGVLTDHSDATRLENVTIPFFVWASGMPAGADLYPLLANRWDPANTRPDYNAARQPLRNGDSGNMSLALLGLSPIPGSFMQPAFVSLQPWPQITSEAGGAIVFWPIEFDGYVLEARDSLVAGDWQPVTGSITTANEFFIHSLPPELVQGTRFFRLRKP